MRHKLARQERLLERQRGAGSRQVQHQGVALDLQTVGEDRSSHGHHSSHDLKARSVHGSPKRRKLGHAAPSENNHTQNAEKQKTRVQDPTIDIAQPDVGIDPRRIGKHDVPIDPVVRTDALRQAALIHDEVDQDEQIRGQLVSAEHRSHGSNAKSLGTQSKYKDVSKQAGQDGDNLSSNPVDQSTPSHIPATKVKRRKRKAIGQQRPKRKLETATPPVPVLKPLPSQTPSAVDEPRTNPNKRPKKSRTLSAKRTPEDPPEQDVKDSGNELPVQTKRQIEGKRQNGSGQDHPLGNLIVHQSESESASAPIPAPIPAPVSTSPPRPQKQPDLSVPAAAGSSPTISTNIQPDNHPPAVTDSQVILESPANDEIQSLAGDVEPKEVGMKPLTSLDAENIPETRHSSIAHVHANIEALLDRVRKVAKLGWQMHTRGSTQTSATAT